MVQAIETRYYGATMALGSRITARCEAGRLTLEYDAGLNQEENHKRAARILATRLGWPGTWATGCMPRPHTGYAHVWVTNERGRLNESWCVLDAALCTT